MSKSERGQVKDPQSDKRVKENSNNTNRNRDHQSKNL